MIEYHILRADDPSDLIEAVRLHLSDGWELAGGVAVSEYHVQWTNERKGYSESETRAVWAQAVIRRPTHAVNAESAK